MQKIHPKPSRTEEKCIIGNDDSRGPAFDLITYFLDNIIFIVIIFFGILISTRASAEIEFVPIKFRQTSGTRPFIDVQLNGHAFEFMVHSNAGFYAMTNHSNAKKSGINDLEKKDAYGIDKAGEVSKLGRDKASVEVLQVGMHKSLNAPILIFETPDNEMDGMLGVRWLRDKHAIVDYDKYRVGLPKETNDSEEFDKQLIRDGYTAHKLEWDSKESAYFIKAEINGGEARMGVNTVGVDVLDSKFVALKKIEVGPVIDVYGGPAGATGKVFLAKRALRISLDNQSMQDFQPRIYDTEAYSGRNHSAEKVVAGQIGADFMLANQAIIDFGTEWIFVKSR